MPYMTRKQAGQCQKRPVGKILNLTEAHGDVTRFVQPPVHGNHRSSD